MSVFDLTCRLDKGASCEEIKATLKRVSENEMKGVLGRTEDNVVSSDFIGSKYSSIFDAGAGITLTGELHEGSFITPPRSPTISYSIPASNFKETQREPPLTL